MTQPNILLIMTDEERYPPPYEDAATAKFRREQLGARESLREGGLEFHRHYAGSTACVPSRATLFAGQYPSRHGVSQTDGIDEEEHRPGHCRRTHAHRMPRVWADLVAAVRESTPSFR